MRCGSYSMSRRQTTRTPRSQTMPMPARAVSKCVGQNNQARGMIGDAQTRLNHCTGRRRASLAKPGARCVFRPTHQAVPVQFGQPVRRSPHGSETLAAVTTDWCAVPGQRRAAGSHKPDSQWISAIGQKRVLVTGRSTVPRRILIAQPGVWSRPGALSELRWPDNDHRADLGAAGGWEVTHRHLGLQTRAMQREPGRRPHLQAT